MNSIIDETRFEQMLALERRRCERIPSHRYGLMLMDLGTLSMALPPARLEEIGNAVTAAMRETDITGWQQHSQTIGVILTTLNGERATIENVVGERITGALLKYLSEAQISQISFACFLFPDDDHRQATGGRPDRRKKTYKIAKRTVDVIGSAAAVTLLSPVFLVLAATIKLTSSGPVFFKQRRVGQFGEEFTFIKFRSMVVNNDPEIHRKYVEALIENKAGSNNGEFKIKNDPRITPVGRFLRRTSLDELPQFFNTLRGDMSLVGPRPPIPYEMEKYALWHRRRVLEAKPGITGVWQVHGRTRTTFDDMVRMDLRYIRSRSFWLDLKLLLKTPYAVLKGNGAY